MSKRAQERKTEDEFVVSTSRSACLVSRNLSEKQIPSSLHTAWGIKSWVEILLSQAVGNQCGEVCVRVQAQGNLCDGSRTNLQGRSWTTTIFRSPTINTVRKFSRTFDSSRIVRKINRYLTKRSMYLSGDICVNNDESSSSSWEKLQ